MTDSERRTAVVTRLVIITPYGQGTTLVDVDFGKGHRIVRRDTGRKNKGGIIRAIDETAPSEDNET
jgi:hypothetical protein